MPRTVFDSPEYIALSDRARRLLWDMRGQYTGRNNGDLTASFRPLRHRGWTSKDQLGKATQELLEAGFLIVTRPGGRNRTQLYAMTFEAIDECLDKDGQAKHDAKPTSIPLHLWRQIGVDTKAQASGRSAAPPHGATCPAPRGNRRGAA